MKKIATILGVLLLLPAAVSAHASDPLATVKADVKKILKVVGNDNLSAKAKKEKLRSYYPQMFATEELARRTLGANWRKLDQNQQQEFIHLYGRLLEQNYLDKILNYKNQKIEYVRQIMFSKTRAEVETKVATDSGKVSINYKMSLVNGVWKVYDVVAENVSLILNYRSQFQAILADKTPEQMLAQLKTKVEQGPQ